MVRQAAVVVALVTLSAGSALAQAPARPAQSKESSKAVPRTPWGKPSFEGVWSRHSITPLERPKQFAGREFLTDAEAAELERVAVENATDEARPEDKNRDVSSAYNDFWWDRPTKVVPTRRTSLIIEPKDGKVPAFTAAGAERDRTEPQTPSNRSLGTGGRGTDSWLDRSLWERCLTQGSTRLAAGAYNPNVQIFQSEHTIAIVHEQIHEARIIPIDGRPHLSSNVRQWLGDSRGRWEGDTLVIETTNFTDKTNFRGATDNLKMIERISRSEDGFLTYEATFEDPTTWVQPWTIQLPMPKVNNYMFEYACHEGNYGMVGLLQGARAQEKAAAAAGKQSN
ncbi:MAG: hypothetical protein AB7O32_05850 [Vicinamibacterales bacterium]